MALARPALLVAAPASGQGKTLVTAALARKWRNQGLVVQAFKCGPDFIDGMVLQVATCRPVYNLDLGMCGLEDGKVQLYKAAQQADVIVVEGVMGLYDGTPSTADIALQFGLPVALAINAGAMAQTFGAIAQGLFQYQPALNVAGVIANQVGSQGHANLLKSALPKTIPWLGALQKDDFFMLPERHLGLHLAHEIADIEARIEAAAQLLGDEISLPPVVTFHAPTQTKPPLLLAEKTIAIARDEAFCFIYQANLDCLQNLGATLVYFSPLTDEALPEADAYWLPGGYPELHLQKISQNVLMQTCLKEAAAIGKPILAECGGMMALGQRLNDQPTFGLLPGDSVIQSTLQGLGTQHVAFADKSIGAHTFHYGAFDTTLTPAYVGHNQYGAGEAVYRHGSITASFLHFYFPSNPELAARFFLT